MSTLEQTVSMLEALPEEDLKAIHDITYRFYIHARNPFAPLTKKQILQDLAISREQAANGEFMDFDDAIREIREKYGL